MMGRDTAEELALEFVLRVGTLDLGYPSAHSPGWHELRRNGGPLPQVDGHQWSPEIHASIFAECSGQSAGAAPMRAPAASSLKPSRPFTRWSIRKLAGHLRRNRARPVLIGRQAPRCLLARRGISFQRTKTWKESPAPDFDAKLVRIEYAINERPGRTFAFDEFGPLGIGPTAVSCWAEKRRPDRLPAAYRRTHGITCFHGCYSIGHDQMAVDVGVLGQPH
ncbi:hypothetical protein DWB77_07382 [Streptomyces hundungensis]|uniref:Uncharacterized protein n=1 Tax=Streptomyces hundungensis TaxID=1077946 RepID=A0A387HMQ8_9ACTN|nr:hypothetical protein DWB77_07382 [Streptomyces hundungensis]